MVIGLCLILNVGDDNMIKSILFDVNGTLIKSKCKFFDFFASKQNRPELSNVIKTKFKEKIEKFSGEKFKPFLEIMTEAINDVFNEKFLTKEINKIYEDYIENEMYIEGTTKSVIKNLAKNFQLGIISNGNKTIVNKQLSFFGIKRFFKIIITSDDANCYKPNKKIFRIALNKMKTKPQNTVFVGNSEKDIFGAKNIGIITICVTQNINADFIIKNFKDLKTVLGNINVQKG